MSYFRNFSFLSGMLQVFTVRIDLFGRVYDCSQCFDGLLGASTIIVISCGQTILVDSSSVWRQSLTHIAPMHRIALPLNLRNIGLQKGKFSRLALGNGSVVDAAFEKYWSWIQRHFCLLDSSRLHPNSWSCFLAPQIQPLIVGNVAGLLIGIYRYLRNERLIFQVGHNLVIRYSGDMSIVTWAVAAIAAVLTLDTGGGVGAMGDEGASVVCNA